MTPLDQHQVEIEKNLAAWRNKPLLQKIYAGFYEWILQHIDTEPPCSETETLPFSLLFPY